MEIRSGQTLKLLETVEVSTSAVLANHPTCEGIKPFGESDETK
ncbi:hypothetical protein QWZ16_21720 [Vibrio ostreicida]|uniref:Uncharacterized protein n=1 Tax=Vibrio ostreicida TaxID=526588 RepID=A0ABT8C1K5_9VIBR|nr:hypothetical protein [Vibrio ostreicida]MDN3612217.1 hypothetical protein [Vibrio ostreicida]